MGKLLYMTKVEVEMNDQSLFHLDVLLAQSGGRSFQVHVGLGGSSDGNLLSLTVGAGVPLVMEYFNGPDLKLRMHVIDWANQRIREGSFVSLPFDFESSNGEVDRD